MGKFRILFLIMLLVTGTIISCDKDDSEDQKEKPGNIPGMGNAKGDLQVIKPFELPEGITFDGEIKGVGDATQAILGNKTLWQKNHLKKDNNNEKRYGSGGQWVILDLSLLNNTGVDTDILIKKGCVFECQTEGYQHAIMVKNIRLHILGNSKLQVKLYVYCINKGKSGSTAQVTYILRGVSTSQLITDLTNALEYKKIGINEFTPEEIQEYERICERIQEIIWAITNGTGVNKKDWEFIESLQTVIDNYQ